MSIVPAMTNMPDTFNVIFDMYSGTMLKVAYGITRDKHLAEDAVQESFLRITKNLERLEDIYSPETRGYILTITRNASLSVLKARNGITNRECPLDEIENVQESCDLEQEVISKVGFEELVSTIRELPKIYADVLYMDWVMDLSIHEISVQLGLQEDTVKKRINRGKKTLQKQLIKKSLWLAYSFRDIVHDYHGRKHSGMAVEC